MKTYDLYMEKVNKSRELGFSDEEIRHELMKEVKRIKGKCQEILVALTFSINPYPAIECKKQTAECVKAIEKICDELKKEISAT